MFKVKNSTGDFIMEAESRKHLIAQALLFFECTEFEVDFNKNKATFLNEECVIEEV